MNAEAVGWKVQFPCAKQDMQVFTMIMTGSTLQNEPWTHDRDKQITNEITLNSF